jgi:hypothetical protein
MPDLILEPAELEQITGYKRAHEQLAELQRQGFSRARRSRLGDVVLERAHYDAVARGAQSAPARPKVRPPRNP